MTFRNALLSVCLLSAPLSHAYQLPEDSFNQEQAVEAQEEVMVFLQGFNETIMKTMQELFKDVLIELRVKYYADFKSLKKNYWQNKRACDEQIVMLKDEFVKEIMPSMNAYFDRLYEQIPDKFRTLEINIYWQQIKAQSLSQFPFMMEQSLKLALEIESIAYARVHNLM